MQNIDANSHFKIVEREIEEAEEFVIEQRLIIDCRREAGYDTMREEALLEHFIDTLERTYEQYTASVLEQGDQPVHIHRTLH